MCLRLPDVEKRQIFLLISFPSQRQPPKKTKPITNEDYPDASAVAASGLTILLRLGRRSYLLALESFPAHNLLLARIQCHHRQNEGDRAGHVAYDRSILPNIAPASTLRRPARGREKYGGAA